MIKRYEIATKYPSGYETVMFEKFKHSVHVIPTDIDLSTLIFSPDWSYKDSQIITHKLLDFEMQDIDTIISICINLKIPHSNIKTFDNLPIATYNIDGVDTKVIEIPHQGA